MWQTLVNELGYFIHDLNNLKCFFFPSEARFLQKYEIFDIFRILYAVHSAMFVSKSSQSAVGPSLWDRRFTVGHWAMCRHGFCGKKCTGWGHQLYAQANPYVLIREEGHSRSTESTDLAKAPVRMVTHPGINWAPDCLTSVTQPEDRKHRTREAACFGYFQFICKKNFQVHLRAYAPLSYMSKIQYYMPAVFPIFIYNLLLLVVWQTCLHASEWFIWHTDSRSRCGFECI